LWGGEKYLPNREGQILDIHFIQPPPWSTSKAFPKYLLDVINDKYFVNTDDIERLMTPKEIKEFELKKITSKYNL